MSESRLPILLLVGPSGAGKSHLAASLEDALKFLHVDIDIRGHFHSKNLHRKWYRFSALFDPVPLVSVLRDQIREAGAGGMVLSLPSTRILTRKQIDVACSVGICTVVLWGAKELCKEARRRREQETGQALKESVYDILNLAAFDTYSGSEFADFRVEAFTPDGSRWPDGELVEVIRRRLSAFGSS